MTSLHRIPRIYPNQNPSAAIKVNRGEICHIEQFFDQYRIRWADRHGHGVPNSKFIFVRTMHGELLAHQRFRHPVLADGKPVLYAGEAMFENGRLKWWSNGSGNYRPDADHAEQAELPMDQFYTYEEILKGVHKAAGQNGKRGPDERRK